MHRKWTLWVALAALLAGAVLVRLGNPGEQVNFRAAMEMWGDALKDAQEVTVLTVTRMTDTEEMALGKQLAASIGSYARRDPQNEAYLQGIAAGLQPYVQRQGIQFEFHVIVSPQVNAFALPGGQIFVFTGMLDRLQSEAEMAMVLGHEMSHVDQYHCAELYQFINAGRRLGVGDLGAWPELLRRMVARGYNQHQEAAADAEGFRLAVQAGYLPAAGAEVWNRISGGNVQASRPGDATPLDETARALGNILRTYGNSHPAHADRFTRLQAMARDVAPPAGKPGFYVGRENHQQRVPRQTRDIPAEWVPAQ